MFFWDSQDQSVFWIQNYFFWDTKYFSGYKKNFLTFSEVNGVSLIVKQKKQHKQQVAKQQEQQQRHEGPEGGAPKVSLCSHWRLLVEFRLCF